MDGLLSWKFRIFYSSVRPFQEVHWTAAATVSHLPTIVTAQAWLANAEPSRGSDVELLVLITDQPSRECARTTIKTAEK